MEDEGKQELVLNDKQLKHLPELINFTNLLSLYCSNNKLTYLPSLPRNLKYLYCRCNKLTSLPTLPQSLEILLCDSNKIISLPVLPKNLERLYCF